MSDNIAIAVLALYQYRQAGCPYGENLAGLNVWINVQRKIFEEWATNHSDAV